MCVCAMAPGPPLPTRAKAEESRRGGRPRKRYEQGCVGTVTGCTRQGVSQWDLAHMLRVEVKNEAPGPGAIYIANSAGLLTSWGRETKAYLLELNC